MSRYHPSDPALLGMQVVDEAVSQCRDPVPRSLVAVAGGIIGSTSTRRWMKQMERQDCVKEQMAKLPMDVGKVG